MWVEKAKNMLLQGECVAHTAEAMGYTNIYHFIRQFKQITGITPVRCAHDFFKKSRWQIRPRDFIFYCAVFILLSMEIA